MEVSKKGRNDKATKQNFEVEARFLRVTVDALGRGWVSFTELVPLFADNPSE